MNKNTTKRLTMLLGLLTVVAGTVLLVAPDINADSKTDSKTDTKTNTKTDAKNQASDKNQNDQTTLKFQLMDFQTGKKITQDIGENKITVINFWATWCPPCVKEIPHMVKIQNEHPDKIQFIGIALSSPEDKLRSFIKKAKINYPIATLDSGRINIPTPESIPTTYIFDASMKQIDKAVGYRSEEYFLSFINQHHQHNN